MKQHNKIYWLYNFIFILIILISIYSLRYKIISKFNDVFFNNKVTNLNLTTDQKIEDFNLFYNSLIESMPSLSQQKETYRIDFTQQKDKYIDLLKNTKTDFDFFCTMSAIEEDIVSFHTDICFPDSSNISTLNCYNIDNILINKNFKPLQTYWSSVIKDACNYYSNTKIINFKYIDGDYLYDSLYSHESYKYLEGFKLDSINNIPANDYITSNLSTYKLNYDSINNNPYRWYYTLNDSIGEKVNVAFSNSKGDKITKELYFDFKIEVIDSFSYLYNTDKSNSDTIPDIYSYADYKNKTGYISIKNFTNSEGDKLKKIIEDFKKFDNIIIDLRDNYGGNKDYSNKYLFSPLYKDTINFSTNWFVPKSSLNNIITNNIMNKLFYQDSSTDEGYFYSENYKYKGSANTQSQTIYYLINTRSASATDGYISMIKENNLGIIIGSNTSGEGLGNSFNCNVLPNSGLVYIYYPSLSYNNNNLNNSLYGTSPDIYINQSKESFYLQRTLEKNGEKIYKYNNMLTYDTVLIKTLELINQFSSNTTSNTNGEIMINNIS